MTHNLDKWLIALSLPIVFALPFWAAYYVGKKRGWIR